MTVFWLVLVAVVAVIIYWLARSKKTSLGHERPVRNTPYKGTLHAAGGVDLKYEVSVREKTEAEEQTAELLKEATRLKNDKDFDGAISCLRRAYELMSESSIIYPIETFLRLPLFLQQAGRYAEAIREFEKLLANNNATIANNFSHISAQEQNGLAAMHRASIFDKMRLASQREKQFVHAVYYRLLSEATTAVGLTLQRRDQDFDRYEDREFWSGRIEKLLKKTDKVPLLNDLIDACIHFSQSCSTAALEKLTADLALLLHLDVKPPISEAEYIGREGTGASDNDTDASQNIHASATDGSLPATDVAELVFNFTQRCFIGEDNSKNIDLSYEALLFERLAAGPVTQIEAYQLPSKQRRLLRELLSQYVMFLEMNKHLSFPADFLLDSSQDQLGVSLLRYVCHYRWPFPQILPK